MGKKCFTIETRLKTEQFPQLYFEKNMEKQSRLFRIVWKRIQENTDTQSQLNTYLQHTYHIDKRTANTLIKTAKGRYHALKELKELEKNNLLVKINKKKQQIETVVEKVNCLKKIVVNNQATEKQLVIYRQLKRMLWQYKQKLNRMQQQLLVYNRQEKEENYAICWGSKQLFKAQYYLKENGFRSHEGWYHAYQRKRDGQINFIGSKDEPKGNQNCQLIYEKDLDYFSLRIRKDLEFMENKNDKFFVVPNLQFYLYREELIKAIEEGNTPFTFRFLRKGRKWYVQVIFTWILEEKNRTDVNIGAIGLDFNDGFISYSETDYYGNLIDRKHFPLHCHGGGNKAKSEMQETVAKIVQIAKQKEKPIVLEELDFKKTKAKTQKARGKAGKRYNKMVHALDYARYRTCFENAGFRNGVKIVFINPAYTSQIGIEKFGYRMKLNCHQAASYVIARKGQGFQDKKKLENRKCS